MNKSIYEKALEILKNRVSKLHINHKIGNKDIAKSEILDIAKAIETHVTPIFEQAITELKQAQKQEKLLNQIKDIINRPYVAKLDIASMLEESKKYVEIENLIKEL